jgi:predicted DNA-binding protein YlxM (UPF0122 family)
MPLIFLRGRAMKDDIEKVEYASMLYDFYGNLLSDARKEVMALYHEDNLSLSEIAEELGQTRQAVHYTLRKAEKALESYEEKLGLVSAYREHQELAARAVRIIDNAGFAKGDAEKLKKIIEQITE